MQRANVGSVEVVGLVDTRFAFPVGGVFPEIGKAASQYRHFLTPDGDVPMICACFLLRADGQTILVDTGYAEAGDARLLPDLETAGVKLADVDTVVFTHLHPDHTAWNIDRKTGDPTFPNARYWAPQADWDFFDAQGADHFTRDMKPLQAAGQLDLFSGEKTVTPSLTTLPTPGHTPGHSSIAIVSGNDRGFILGDVVLSALDVQDPDLVNSFDTDSDQARQTRLTILKRLESGQELVGAAHLPGEGLGHFGLMEGRRVWRPLT